MESHQQLRSRDRIQFLTQVRVVIQRRRPFSQGKGFEPLFSSDLMGAQVTSPIWIALQTNGFGGTEIHTIQFVQALCESGRDVYVVCVGHRVLDGKLDHPRAHVLHVEADLSSDVAADWRELEILFSSRRRECSTLILQKGSVNIGTTAVLKMCRRYFKHIYFVQHSMPPRMHGQPFKRVLRLIPVPSLWWLKERQRRRNPSRYADKVIAVSHAVAQALRRDWGYPTSKIVTISNGVFPEHFHEAVIKRQTKYRSERCGDDRPLTFGMLTRLDKIKGIDIALRAFQRLQSRRSDRKTALLIFGDGEEEYALKSLADQLDIGTQVQFKGFTSESADAFASFDVVVLSSRSEGLPLSLLEGMASGCIPIVTRVGGMPQVVDDPRIGYVVEPNADSLCEAMCAVVDMNASEREAMRTAAVARVREDFNANESFNRLIAVIDGKGARVV